MASKPVSGDQSRTRYSVTMQVFAAVIRFPDGSQRELGRLAECYFDAKEQYQREFGPDTILYGPWSLPISDHIVPMRYRLPGWR
jgi:hypothetical protein